MDFEWDPDKAAYNLAKHGVSFEEASDVFYDELSVTYDDPDHSDEEERFIIIGMSLEGRILIVSHTDRGDRIRLISARPVSRQERRLYETGR